MKLIAEHVKKAMEKVGLTAGDLVPIVGFVPVDDDYFCGPRKARRLAAVLEVDVSEIATEEGEVNENACDA